MSSALIRKQLQGSEKVWVVWCYIMLCASQKFLQQNITKAPDAFIEHFPVRLSVIGINTSDDLRMFYWVNTYRLVQISTNCVILLQIWFVSIPRFVSFSLFASHHPINRVTGSSFFLFTGRSWKLIRDLSYYSSHSQDPYNLRVFSPRDFHLIRCVSINSAKFQH